MPCGCGKGTPAAPRAVSKPNASRFAATAPKVPPRRPQKIAAFKRKHATLLRMPGAPSQEKIDRLSRQLWEFSERVRLQQMATEARAGAGA